MVRDESVKIAIDEPASLPRSPISITTPMYPPHGNGGFPQPAGAVLSDEVSRSTDSDLSRTAVIECFTVDGKRCEVEVQPARVGSQRGRFLIDGLRDAIATKTRLAEDPTKIQVFASIGSSTTTAVEPVLDGEIYSTVSYVYILPKPRASEPGTPNFDIPSPQSGSSKVPSRYASFFGRPNPEGFKRVLTPQSMETDPGNAMCDADYGPLVASTSFSPRTASPRHGWPSQRNLLGARSSSVNPKNSSGNNTTFATSSGSSSNIVTMNNSGDVDDWKKMVPPALRDLVLPPSNASSAMGQQHSSNGELMNITGNEENQAEEHDNISIASPIQFAGSPADKSALVSEEDQDASSAYLQRSLRGDHNSSTTTTSSHKSSVSSAMVPIVPPGGGSVSRSRGHGSPTTNPQNQPPYSMYKPPDAFRCSKQIAFVHQAQHSPQALQGRQSSQSSLKQRSSSSGSSAAASQNGSPQLPFRDSGTPPLGPSSRSSRNASEHGDSPRKHQDIIVPERRRSSGEELIQSSILAMQRALKQRGVFVVAADGGSRYCYISECMLDVSDGDTVVLRRGVYRESIVVKKNINIVAEDPTAYNTIIRAPRGARRVAELQAQSCVLRGIVIEGSCATGVAITSGCGTVDQCEIRGVGVGVEISAPIQPPTPSEDKLAERPTVSACLIHRCEDSGIVLQAGATALIDRNIVNAVGEDGIRAHSKSDLAATENRVQRCGVHGIHIDVGSSALIERNFSQDHRGSGIHAAGPNVHAAENTVYGNKGFGMVVSDEFLGSIAKSRNQVYANFRGNFDGQR